MLECLTSMHRHGLSTDDIADVPALLDGVQLEGFAFHLPIDRHGGCDPAAEVGDWLRRLSDRGAAHRRGVGQPPDGCRPRAAAGRLPGDHVPAASRAPLCGWATATRSRRGAPCSTCTGWRRGRDTATGSGGRFARAGSWWSAEVRRTGWRSRRRGRCADRSTGPRSSPSVRWRRPTGRCPRSAGPAGRAGSPSRRTCTCPCC